jgi:hypothetical protein
MSQMISIAKRFAKIIKAEEPYEREINKMIDERDQEFPTPWSGGEETMEFAVIQPLHYALSNIDSNNLELAKENILGVLDILKMKKVSKTFQRLLKIAAAGETKVEAPKAKLDVPQAVSKYIKNKIESEDYEREEELDFALSALHSAMGYLGKGNVTTAMKSINLAIHTLTEMLAKKPVAKAESR